MGRPLFGSTPPRLLPGAGIGFAPSAELHAFALHGHMGQGQRGGTADHGSLRVVLAAVAGADELVLAAVPGDHATQMGADGVEPDGTDGALSFHDQIGAGTTRPKAPWRSRDRAAG